MIELKTFEDTGRASECRVRFHFTHRLIRRKEKFGNQISKGWCLSHNAIQRLYLSRSTRRLMEVFNNTFAVVYERQVVKKTDSS